MTGAQASGSVSSGGEGRAARDLIKKLAGVGARIDGFLVVPLEASKSLKETLGDGTPAFGLSEALITAAIAVPKGVVGALNAAEDTMKVVDAWNSAPAGTSRGRAALAASSSLLNDLSAVASGVASVTPLFAPTVTVPLMVAATTMTLAGGLIKGFTAAPPRSASTEGRQSATRSISNAGGPAAAPPSGPIRSVRDLDKRLGELVAALKVGRAQLVELMTGRIKPLGASVDAYLQGSSRSSYRQATRSVEEATEAVIASARALDQARVDVEKYRSAL
ncbi:hypothetical protein [Pseudoclavibacter helvolus]|uniref:Uncharacterized protein n=1 Tax=Pseudoclavibacter helvolus TaxID=255205 RepID=A0A7W4UPF7_9MICO|nr:hypothetical protein [Pseudoclavibacter helvolus]MBB2958240.1 hypothetical protein [Pseudoclavibacter helvolus]